MGQRRASGTGGLRGVARMLGIGTEARGERRKAPRIQCRLSCTLRRGRRWLPARVLDVSEGGLCLLSPVELRPRQPVLLRIDVPRLGPVEVEAVAWHVRRVKSGRAHRKAWSIGMMIEKAGEGFEVLLPSGTTALEVDMGAEALSSRLASLTTSSRADEGREEDALEEDCLSAEELDSIDPELLSPEELESLAKGPSSSASITLRLFRVRLKARTGPRTRTLTLGAVSAAEAESLAAAELDDTWRILAVEPVEAP